jgi:hypothetical protein
MAGVSLDVGSLLRTWREKRRLTQLDLALWMPGSRHVRSELAMELLSPADEGTQRALKSRR